MENEQDLLNLPLKIKCVHKSWKARMIGYQEINSIFEQHDEDKGEDLMTYVPLIKRVLDDTNVIVLEKGLEAILTFAENSTLAAKPCHYITRGIITRCLGSSRLRIRDLAFRIICAYIENERHESVQRELIRGLENKSPKIVMACLETTSTLLRSFGPHIINIKPLTKFLVKLFEDRDIGVRAKTEELTVEIYRWTKTNMKYLLNILKPIQSHKLQRAFAKVKHDKPEPTKFFNSHTNGKKKIEKPCHFKESMAKTTSPEKCDSYDNLQAHEVLSKISDILLQDCKNKKWLIRKEALDKIYENVSSYPKLIVDDYSLLIDLLKNIIDKDINLMVAISGIKCLTAFANGLRKNFHHYALQFFPILLIKFKEKKQNMVLALREAVDACFRCLSLDLIKEDVSSALNSKNPQIKAETALFMSRCFEKSRPSVLSRSIMQPYCASLIKTMYDTDPTVRDASRDALAMALRVAGEKVINPFLKEIEAGKMAMIKERFERFEKITEIEAGKMAMIKERFERFEKITEIEEKKNLNRTFTISPKEEEEEEEQMDYVIEYEMDDFDIESERSFLVNLSEDDLEVEDSNAYESPHENLHLVEGVEGAYKSTKIGRLPRNWKERLHIIDDIAAKIEEGEKRFFSKKI